MYNHGNWEGFGHMMGGGFMFWIFMLLIVFLIFSFFKNNQNNNNSQPKKDDALEILEKRFANSEISEEEYHSKRKILKG